MNYSYDWNHDLSIIRRTFATEKSGTPPDTTPAHLEHWKVLKNGQRTNEDLFVIRIPDGSVTMRHDCSRLWSPGWERIDYDDVAALYHPEQSPLIRWIVPKVFQMLFHHIDEQRSPNFRLRWLRAVRTQDGQFWYTCYECIPFQYTDENVMYSYVGRVSYLKPYAGEALHVRFTYDGQPDAEDTKRLDLLNGYLDDVKGQALEKVFGLTPIRAEIIRRRARQQPLAQIADGMNVGASTTKDHCKHILKTLRAALPSENFGRLDDVVRYFRITGLLPQPPQGG